MCDMCVYFVLNIQRLWLIYPISIVYRNSIYTALNYNTCYSHTKSPTPRFYFWNPPGHLQGYGHEYFRHICFERVPKSYLIEYIKFDRCQVYTESMSLWWHSSMYFCYIPNNIMIIIYHHKFRYITSINRSNGKME